MKFEDLLAWRLLDRYGERLPADEHATSLAMQGFPVPVKPDPATWTEAARLHTFYALLRTGGLFVGPAGAPWKGRPVHA